MIGVNKLILGNNQSLNICRHNKEKHYAKSLCKQCYQQYYFQKKSNINVKDIDTFFDFKKRLYTFKGKSKSDRTTYYNSN